MHRARNSGGPRADGGRMANPVLPDDPSYPPALLDLAQAGLPPCEALHTRGTWPPRPGIAVVGTREPTPEAVAFTRSLAEAITRAGWAVWSGGARGIDAAAHQAALDRRAGTVVVMPSGFAQPYPPEHAELFARVVDAGGTLITPFPEDAQPTLASFHFRNAVLAALTIATVVVQAGFKSGTRSTAKAARRLRRPLFVVPHSPWDHAGQGCALELQKGAHALADARDLVTKLKRARHAQMTIRFAPAGAAHAHVNADEGARRRGSDAAVAAPHDRAIHAREHDRGRGHAHDHAHDHARVAHALEPAQQRVLDAIGETPIHTDDLCERTALPVTVVTAALLTLTLQAVVVEAPAGCYRRSSL